MSMRVLITGAAGFIGSHAARYFARRFPQAEIITIEKLNYASSLDRLVDLRGRVEVVLHDLRAPLTDRCHLQMRALDYVVHFAAETHVDKALVDPRPFVESNILGTFNLLEYCRLRQPDLGMFFMISTDESYGPAGPGIDHREDAPHRPSNPYSATKAAAEDLAHAWSRSMGVPTIVTNTMNNIGEMQHSEKYIPKIVRSIVCREPITVHGSPDNQGSRKYLYAGDHADAIAHLIVHGRRGERYNVVGTEEVTNLEMVRRIEAIMVAEAKVRFVDFHSTRPGHDLRYSLDGSKMAELGWRPPTSFDEALRRSVTFLMENPGWL